MAEEETGIYVNQEQFSCPICMDLLRDPVTIPCGHNYCLDCIKRFWEQKNQRKVCSCPECRQTFSPRPTLNKNTLFAEVVEKLRHTGIRSQAMPGDKINEGISKEKQELIVYCEQELKQSQRRCQQIIREREEELHLLNQTVVFLRSSAQSAVKETERIFSEMIQSIESLCSELTEMINVKEQMELDEAHGFMEKLEQEIVEMKRRDAEYDQLSHLDDKSQFLKSYESLRGLPRLEIPPAVLVNPDFSFEMVSRKLTDLSGDIKDLCQKKSEKLAKKVQNLKFIPTPEPKVREQFLEYSGPLTLDLNTAHRNLSVCTESGEVTFSRTALSVPDHPERFDIYHQVLCRESVSGRCYFEAEWSGKGPVQIAVCYEEISRKGISGLCAFGHNFQSWSLVCSDDSYALWHSEKETRISKMQASRRIGVYVDFHAGILAFYSITDTMSLIHRIQVTFSQPLYPGFRITTGSSLKLCYPL
ncbi:tripartite motif-containing protein 16-like protein [Triplophysa rosa]|uniref:Tripartite motif-containing protein 16-like protein n=1 Tax=Triplophysa rosa TaxID=992332 RepID=A0A9W7TMT0_TRIRA|nr:tripartite motif-containing protein 16-like protein [Triplophysa rosa]KAI7799679.1 putative tripartite motif-containing protein 16-like protein [Triplophysa rosa]